MARFDVYELRNRSGLVLDCQADILLRLSSRLVVPLIELERAPQPAARLNPVFRIAGRPYVMVTQYAAAVQASELGALVGSLRDKDTSIVDALDMLLSGF